MITRRDQDIINMVEEFKAATTSQIQRLYFTDTSPRYCRKRLRYLYDSGFVRRVRSTINNDYAYIIERNIQQLHHNLIRSELYTVVKLNYDLLEWHNEMPVSDIRPDALAYIKNSIVYPVMFEIHLNNHFDFDKYNQDFIPLFGSIPRVVICTDKAVKIPMMKVRFKIVKLDMSGIMAIL